MSDIELTEEQKENLRKAGAVAFDLEAKWPYVPKAYRKKDSNNEYIIPKSFWPVFTLKCLDGVDSSLMEDKLYGSISLGKVDAENKTSEGTTMPLKSGRVRIESCRLGIIDWKNYRDINGEIIAPPEKDKNTGTIAEKSIRLIHPDLQIELVNAMNRQATLSDEELLGLD